jgi:hypothetical protein
VRERGAVKHTYSMRKSFWDKVSEFVSSGYSAIISCDNVYEAYGPRLPVTHSLWKMNADKRTGNWPTRLTICAQ